MATITHIHMSVIPLLAGNGTIFLDARAHKTIYDGCQVAKSRGATVKRFRFEDPDHLDSLLHESGANTKLVCIDGGDQLRKTLCDHTLRVLDAVDRVGAYTPNRSGFPIVELPIADRARIAEVGEFLFDRGVYVTLAAFPLVPRQEVGFRAQLTAANTETEVDALIGAIEELAERGELQRAGDH
jgi:7-keto-8-aminopelargonate synthetase-like enzyme